MTTENEYPASTYEVRTTFGTHGRPGDTTDKQYRERIARFDAWRESFRATAKAEQREADAQIAEAHDLAVNHEGTCRECIAKAIRAGEGQGA